MRMNAMKTRYISDLHFGHRNIIRYDNRPWLDPDEMEEGLIDRWNSVVAKEDLTYVLGDFCWSQSYEDWVRLLTRLRGQVFFIKGNHDRTKILKELDRKGHIAGWSQQEIAKDSGRNVVLNHSPMPFFVNMHHGNTYHLYGHVHISFDYQVIKHVRRQIEDLYQHEVRMYNVGCMIRGMDYTPRTLDEIIQIDKENRAFEEGHLEDYLKSEVEMGFDKARMESK